VSYRRLSSSASPQSLVGAAAEHQSRADCSIWRRAYGRMQQSLTQAKAAG